MINSCDYTLDSALFHSAISSMAAQSRAHSSKGYPNARNRPFTYILYAYFLHALSLSRATIVIIGVMAMAGVQDGENG